jgi:DNA/RNA endonuclease YhcR with UshA esterase domain
VIVKATEDGRLVQIDAVVTVGFEMHRREGDNIYVQDATGGLQVFGSALIAHELEIGDSIRVVGLLATFNQERQIASPQVEVLGTGTVPAPIDLQANAFNALTHEGELVRIVNVEVVSVPSTTDGQGRYNLVVRDAQGDMQIRIEGGIAEHFPLDFWEVGGRYTVTGALGNFQGTAQLKPRMQADVEEL